MKFILSGSQMPTAQPAKLPYCGADAATEELLPEPSQDAMRLAELEQENDNCVTICATCSQRWHPLSGCCCRIIVG